MAFSVPVWLVVQEELHGNGSEAAKEEDAPVCFDSFSDDALFEMFHLHRPCITFITDAVRTRVKTVAFKKPLPSVDVMVMISLNYYAHGAFTPAVATKADLALKTGSYISTVVNTVSGVIAGMSDVFISFPLTPEARTRIASEAEELCGIPNVLGVLAPAHFKIRASPYEKDSFKCFINALGYTSVMSQFICDSEGNILSVEKCCVGSTFEQEMWESSFKGREVEDGLHGPFWFIGGKGYSLSKHVLTPVSEPSNDSETRFNEAHAKMHHIMHVMLCSMKRRFKCLMQLGFADESSLNKKSNIIKACSVLHNIAKKFSVPLPPGPDSAEPVYPGKPHCAPAEVNADALKARQELIDKNFSVVSKSQSPLESDPSKEDT